MTEYGHNASLAQKDLKNLSFLNFKSALKKEYRLLSILLYLLILVLTLELLIFCFLPPFSFTGNKLTSAGVLR